MIYKSQHKTCLDIVKATLRLMDYAPNIFTQQNRTDAYNLFIDLSKSNTFDDETWLAIAQRLMTFYANLRDEQGNSILYYPHYFKAEHLIFFVREIELDPNEKGNSYLIHAIETFCKVEHIKAFFLAGTNPQLTGERDDTLLTAVVRSVQSYGPLYYPHAEKIIHLLNDHRVNFNLRNKHNATALLKAISQNNVKGAELILDSHSDVVLEVNGYEETLLTPLSIAIWHYMLYPNQPYLKLIEKLLIRGADPTLVARTGPGGFNALCSPLTYAHKFSTSYNNNQLVPLLEKYLVNKIDPSRYWFIEGKNVKDQDTHKLTPLHYSVYLQNLDMVKSLIELGAQVNAQDEKGRTPLYYCIGTADWYYSQKITRTLSPDRVKIAELLIKHGASHRIKDETFYSPLDYAGEDDIEVYEVLENHERLLRQQEHEQVLALEQAKQKEIVESPPAPKVIEPPAVESTGCWCPFFKKKKQVNPHNSEPKPLTQPKSIRKF